ADLPARHLAFARLLQLPLDRVGDALDRVDGHRTLLAGAREPAHDLRAIERLATAVLLHHARQRVLDPLVRPEPPATPVAVTSTTDRVALLAEAGVHDPVLQVMAERAAHPVRLPDPMPIDREAVAERAHLVPHPGERGGVAHPVERTPDELGDGVHLRVRHSAPP